MTREEQDKLWDDLSEESKEQMRDRYNKPIEDTDPNAEYYRGIRYQTGLMFGKHNLKPSLTYEDVARELFGKGCFQFADDDGETYFEGHANSQFFLNFTSPKQAEKLIAIHKLLNVAKYLNKNEDGSDWVPDWGNEYEDKFYIYIKELEDRIGVAHN